HAAVVEIEYRDAVWADQELVGLAIAVDQADLSAPFGQLRKPTRKRGRQLAQPRAERRIDDRDARGALAEALDLGGDRALASCCQPGGVDGRERHAGARDARLAARIAVGCRAGHMADQ